MKETTELHYRYNMFYLLSICVIAIIILLTVDWGAIPQLANLISFGLTLTSLFLSLIAIIFSIVSNDGFSKSSGILRDASQQISQMTANLNLATQSIEKKISSLPEMIEVLGQNVGAQHNELLDRLSSMASPQTNTLPSIEGRDLDSFLTSSSYTGLIILFASKLALQTHIPFKLEEIGNLLTKEYGYGFMVACSAMGLVEYVKKDDLFTISRLDEHISEKIEQSVTNRATNIWGSDSAAIAERMKGIEDLKKIFQK